MAKKVLIVDDDPDLLAMLCLALKGAGYVTRTSTSGREGLEQAQRSPPDLIVLDLVLPDLNGLSVCEALRRHPATASIPIVMLTAMPGEFPRLAGVEAGVDAYILKPFEVEELITRLDGLLPASGSRNGTGATRPPAPRARRHGLDDERR